MTFSRKLTDILEKRDQLHFDAWQGEVTWDFVNAQILSRSFFSLKWRRGPPAHTENGRLTHQVPVSHTNLGSKVS